MMPMRVPLCLRREGLEPLETARVRSGWESEPVGLRLRSLLLLREVGRRALSSSAVLSLAGRACWEAEGATSLKMWTVSVAEETQRREEVALNAIL